MNYVPDNHDDLTLEDQICVLVYAMKKKGKDMPTFLACSMP